MSDDSESAMNMVIEDMGRAAKAFKQKKYAAKFAPKVEAQPEAAPEAEAGPSLEELTAILGNG